MEKIYAKFVKDREKQFQIETDLWRDGKKILVTKRNLYKEGEGHIRNIYETFLMYRDRGLLCSASLEEIPGGVQAVFSYVSGATMEELLLNAIKKQDREKLSFLIQWYEEILSAVCRPEDEAEITGEFSEVFGGFPRGTQGYKNAIFDLTFDNIICDPDQENKKSSVIDYEWRFPFAVEKEFIKFRAVYAFLMKHAGNVHNIFTDADFYRAFGLEEENKETYLMYNESFIHYIYGEHGYNRILENYKKNTMPVCDERAVAVLRNIAYKDRGQMSFEDKSFEMLMGEIEKHKDFYDNYEKFFSSTRKLKDTANMGYLSTEIFYDEFAAYIQNAYDVMDYYKNQSEGKEQIVEQMDGMIRKKDEEHLALQEKYSRDYEMLTNKVRELEERLAYIQSCKAYRVFLEKKVEERFKQG